MPASMISAPFTGIEYVSGSSRLIVASGPRPGRRPMKVPTVQPIAQNMRFCQVSACSKPNARLCRISIWALEQRQLQAEAFPEAESDDDQADANLEIAHDGIAGAGEGG